MKLENHGFSLVSTMVAAGVGLIIMAAFVQQFAMIIKSEARIDLMALSRDLEADISEGIIKSVNCGIPALPAPSISVSDQNWSASTTYNLTTTGIITPLTSFKGGDIYNKGILINSVTIDPTRDKISGAQKYVAMDTNDPSDLNNAKSIRAELNFKISSSYINVYLHPVSIPILLELNNTKTAIIGCQVAGGVNGQLQMACLQLGGNWDDVKEKCDVPCPTGTIDRNGQCLPRSEQDHVVHCQPNAACSVNNRFIF